MLPRFESGFAEAVGEAVGLERAFLVLFFGGDFAGDTLSSGEAVGEASAFLRVRRLAGDSAGEALVSAAGEASVFFVRRCLAGEAEASGDVLELGVGDCA
jgi:hypothetical protein